MHKGPKNCCVHGLFLFRCLFATPTMSFCRRKGVQRPLRLLSTPCRGVKEQSRVETTCMWQASLPLTAPKTRGTPSQQKCFLFGKAVVYNVLEDYTGKERWIAVGNRDRAFRPGDRVQHFKRETVDPNGTQYLYQIVGVATHSESREPLMIYQALYDDYRLYARPYDMFMSEVDREKYPDIKQQYRFEKVEE